MKKNRLICIVLLMVSTNVKAIKVKFTTANMSVNVAEGTTGIFAGFQIYPNSFEPEESDPIELIDFPSISYDDIAAIGIEEGTLARETTFSRSGTFEMTPNVTFGSNENLRIIQGNTYAYQLILEMKSGKKIVLLNKSITTNLLDPQLNCVKLNNLYRKACHNCFQESIVDPYDGAVIGALYKGGFYQALNFTRVVELDLHKSDDVSDWDVRHVGGGSKNNCVSPNDNIYSLGDNPLSVCLLDITLWHLDHPNHDPIILYLDLKSDFTSHQNNPNDLDSLLITTFGGVQNIYRPSDIKGILPGDKRTAAQQNNWPSMGDLTGKIVIVLTGKGKYMDQYLYSLRDPSVIPVAFASRTTPDPGDDFVFYNMGISQAFFAPSTPQNISGLGYINRVWSSTGFPLYIPGNFNNTQYSTSITAKMNNMAVANIKQDFNSSGHPTNGWQEANQVIDPVLTNNRIRSTYQNVTQAAINTIWTDDLIVESGTHYRMVAGSKVTLKPGVLIKEGTDTKIKIDDCGSGTYDYSLRKKAPSEDQLTQDEITSFMNELNKGLYNYNPEDNEEIVALKVYPNPVTDFVTISYTNYLIKDALFTLYDLTGRVIQVKRYVPETEGKQSFTIDVSQLIKGTYLYTMQVSGKEYNGKIIK